MPKVWQFWPMTGPKVINLVEEQYNRVIEQNRQEEARLVAREEELKVVGDQLSAKHGLRFIGTLRRHPYGTSFPRNPKLQWRIPPKSVIELGFEIAPAGTAGWRVRQSLVEGVVFSGKLSTGWNVWLEEKNLENLI